MEENKKEETEVVEEKNQSTNSQASEDVTQSVLFKPILFAAIVTAIDITHGILGFLGGNLTWLIINALCVAGCLVVGLLTLKFFLAEGKNYIHDKNKGKVLAAWIILVVTMAFAALSVLGFSIDMIRNLIGVIRGNI